MRAASPHNTLLAFAVFVYWIIGTSFGLQAVLALERLALQRFHPQRSQSRDLELASEGESGDESSPRRGLVLSSAMRSRKSTQFDVPESEAGLPVVRINRCLPLTLHWDEQRPNEILAVVFSVEHLRMWAYISFLLLVFEGYIFTSFFSSSAVKKSIKNDFTLLHRMYGYNNVCLFFDFPPAVYILPFQWMLVTLPLFLGYLFASFLRLQSEMIIPGEERSNRFLTPTCVRWLQRMKMFEALMASLFSLIFAVNYSDSAAEGNPRREKFLMMLHTVPFFGLQLGLLSLSVSNIIHGYSGYWRILGLLGTDDCHHARTPCWVRLMKPYVCVLACIVVFKITYCVIAWENFHRLREDQHPKWQNPPAELVYAAKTVDCLFLFVALIVPLSKSMLLVLKHREKIEPVYVPLLPVYKVSENRKKIRRRAARLGVTARQLFSRRPKAEPLVTRVVAKSENLSHRPRNCSEGLGVAISPTPSCKNV